jgi:Mg2+ and Co2+ transporter CorA
VNLKLDQHRNQLIGIDLIMTGFTCSLAIMTATAGYFGMNLNSYIQVETCRLCGIVWAVCACVYACILGVGVLVHGSAVLRALCVGCCVCVFTLPL